MSQSSAWIAIEKPYYALTVRRQPVVLVRGQGCRAWDADGKEYLGLVAGVLLNTFSSSTSRFIAPLTITMEGVDDAAERLEVALKQL